MNWSAKIISHNGEKRIAVYFEKNKELIERIKQLEGSRWSQKMKVWHLPDTEIYRKQFRITTSETKLINQEGIDAITKFTFWLRSKRYSEKTIIIIRLGMRSSHPIASSDLQEALCWLVQE